MYRFFRTSHVALKKEIYFFLNRILMGRFFAK